MKASSHNQSGSGCEEISQSEKDFTACEVSSQIRKSLRILILRGGFSRGEIADALGVLPSQVSMWLSHTDDRRKVSVDHARSILRLVKPQPRIVLGAIEDLETALDQLVDAQFGPNRDPNRF